MGSFTSAFLSCSSRKPSRWSPFFFFFCHVACGILVPQTGMEPVPPAVAAHSLNHWTGREVLSWFSWGSSRPLLQLRQVEPPHPPTHTSLHGRTGRDVVWDGRRNRAGSRWSCIRLTSWRTGGISLGRSQEVPLDFLFPLSEMPSCLTGSETVPWGNTIHG